MYLCNAHRIANKWKGGSAIVLYFNGSFIYEDTSPTTPQNQINGGPIQYIGLDPVDPRSSYNSLSFIPSHNKIKYLRIINATNM